MKKRILVVTPRYPFPVVGGDRLRIVQLAKALQADFSLDLLSLATDPNELGLAPAPQDNPFNDIAQVHLPHRRSLLNCLLALPTRRSLQLAYFWSPAMAREVARRAPQYDALLFHLARTAQYLPAQPHPPAVMELTDAISLNYQRIRDTRGVKGLRAAVFALEQPRIARYEQSLLPQFSANVLVSPVDRDVLLKGHGASGANLLVCPNGIDLTRYPMTAHSPDSRTIAFVGNLQSLQNLDAALWFAREVLPRLRERDPRYRFKVIGRIHQVDHATLARFDGVDVTGEVPVIADQLVGSLCGVCPVRIGAGIQNKILEYMATGLPTLVTAVGLEGLAARPGQDLLVANEPQEFVAAISALSSGALSGSDLAAAGRRYVEQHHNWQRNLQPLVDHFKSLTA